MEITMGKRILQNRKRLGMTQDALAEKLGVTAQAVSKWENDQSCPDIAMLPRLAEIFGITTDSLLGMAAPAKEAEVVTEESPDLHIDQKDAHWEFSWDSGRKGHIVLAIWMILAAVMMLAAKYLNQSVNLWTALWTTALLVFGLYGLWPQFSFFHLGCGLAGGYLIAGELFPGVLILQKDHILPIVLLLFGISLLADAGKKKKNPIFRIASHKKNKEQCFYETEGETFSFEMAFGSRQQTVELPLLRHGDAEVAFGELTLDLRGCREFAQDCSLDLECAFGELTVLLPACVRAKPDSSTAFGSVSVSGHPDPDAAQTIRLDCDVCFGQIILRYL